MSKKVIWLVSSGALVLLVVVLAIFVWGRSGPTDSDVIVDGPWTSLPDDSEVALTDQDSGAITLKTDPNTLVFVTEPDPDMGSFANSISSLGVYQDRLYLGYGDTINKQGPIDIVSYDPATGGLLRELSDVPGDAIGSWAKGESGRFYASRADSRESATFGSYYFHDGVDWQKRRTVYGGLHVYNPVEYGDRLYIGHSSDIDSQVDYPHVLVSYNRGLTWEYEQLDIGAGKYYPSGVVSVSDATTGDQLYALAYVDIERESGQSVERRLYQFDGQSWQREQLAPQGIDLRLSDAQVFLDRLLVTYYIVNEQTGRYDAKVGSWDGEIRRDIPYLQGLSVRFPLFTEEGGWLYALVPPAGQSSYSATSYTLVRTQDLEEWSILGNLSLPAGAALTSVAILYDRLYVGVQNSPRSIEGQPEVEILGPSWSESLASATLTWDADVPEGAAISVQIQADKDYNAVSTAPWLGPDGTSSSFYTTSGQPLPAQQEGAGYFKVALSRSPNSSGSLPYIRSITLSFTNGSTTYLVDEGAGLYTVANASTSASFDSEVFELEASIAGGSLYFDAETPEGTSVTFQVRSGGTSEELDAAPFVGPDGSEDTSYSISGTPFWTGSDGDRFVQYRATLSSDRPEVAPFLRQVILETRDGILDHFDIEPGETGPWIAGEPYPVRVTARSAGGGVVPISGELMLTAQISETDFTSLLSPQSIQLIEGEADTEVSLLRAIPSQICVGLMDTLSCSGNIEVQAAGADWLKVETPGLEISSPVISPHGTPDVSFSVVVTAMDRYDNVADGYLGQIHCEFWQSTVVDPLAIPEYTFTSTDAGSHQFERAASVSTPGEYSLVCLDNENPQVGGALAITIG